MTGAVVVNEQQGLRYKVLEFEPAEDDASKIAAFVLEDPHTEKPFRFQIPPERQHDMKRIKQWLNGIQYTIGRDSQATES